MPKTKKELKEMTTDEIAETLSSYFSMEMIMTVEDPYGWESVQKAIREQTDAIKSELEHRLENEEN